MPRLDAALDDELSRRPLELDPAGYYIIRVDREARELVAEFYTNTINKDGEGGLEEGCGRPSRRPHCHPVPPPARRTARRPGVRPSDR